MRPATSEARSISVRVGEDAGSKSIGEKPLRKLALVACLSTIATLLLSVGGCRSRSDANSARLSNIEATLPREPTIEIAPAESVEDNYKILTGESMRLTVHASGAERANLFYRPVTASDRLIELGTLDKQTNGSYFIELQTPMDFNGEVWARVRYPDGETIETEHLQVAVGEKVSQALADDTDESDRADKFTKGRIKRAKVKPGGGNVRITINVPAFTLTLWQNDNEIEKYYVGVGRKEFPIPIGMRTASKIILNPDWVPPDSKWVRASGIEPYTRIPASDPDNPLGKIKIPLGDAYLLHEAQGPSDIGNLVSHGCVRVMRNDIFELTKKIVAARGLPLPAKEIESARRNSRRRVVDLGREIVVDINYDTIVVEGGKLYIYPDVYDQNTNTVDALRNELDSYGVDTSRLDENKLTEMLETVNSRHKYVIDVADLKNANARAKGKTEPLTPQQAKTS